MCAVVPTDVLDSDMFSALTESHMSAAVAAAMNYLHKRGNSVSLSVTRCGLHHPGALWAPGLKE